MVNPQIHFPWSGLSQIHGMMEEQIPTDPITYTNPDAQTKPARDVAHTTPRAAGETEFSDEKKRSGTDSTRRKRLLLGKREPDGAGKETAAEGGGRRRRTGLRSRDHNIPLWRGRATKGNGGQRRRFARASSCGCAARGAIILAAARGRRGGRGAPRPRAGGDAWRYWIGSWLVAVHQIVKVYRWGWRICSAAVHRPRARGGWPALDGAAAGGPHCHRRGMRT